MTSYKLSKAAEHDLANIAEYGFQTYGIERAMSYGEMLESALTYLAEFPKVNRLRDEFVPPVRIYPVGVHIVIYRILDDNHIKVIRIRHHSEDWLPDV